MGDIDRGLIWIILNRHAFGAHVYLVGDNVESAKLMGINVGRTRVMVFALVGVAARAFRADRQPGGAVLLADAG